MLMNSQKLVGIKVETESGQYLGRVQSFDLDIDTQSVRYYHIKPNLLEGGMFSESLQVHQGQVVMITEETMVVVDNVVKYKETVPNKVFVGTQAQVGAG
jgi:sporulation protein YlmC with PRC-barrel domain